MFPYPHCLISDLTVSDFNSLILFDGLFLLTIDFITNKILYNLSVKKESTKNE